MISGNRGVCNTARMYDPRETNDVAIVEESNTLLAAGPCVGTDEETDKSQSMDGQNI